MDNQKYLAVKWTLYSQSICDGQLLTIITSSDGLTRNLHVENQTNVAAYLLNIFWMSFSTLMAFTLGLYEHFLAKTT